MHPFPTGPPSAASAAPTPQPPAVQLTSSDAAFAAQVHASAIQGQPLTVALLLVLLCGLAVLIWYVYTIELNAAQLSTTVQQLKSSLNKTYDSDGKLFNVLDYGATGNGTTDDTAAFAACLIAAGVGGSVVVPAGRYVISKALTPLTNQTISLQGCRLVANNATGPVILLQNVYSVRFQGELYIDDPQAVSTTAVVVLSGSSAQAVRFCHFDRITAFNVFQVLDMDVVNECSFSDIHADGVRNIGINFHTECHDNSFDKVFLAAASINGTSGIVFSSIAYSNPTIGGNQLTTVTCLAFQFGVFIDSGVYEVFWGDVLVDSCATGLVINGNVQRIYIDYLWSSADSNNAIRLNGTAAAPITDLHITKCTVRLSTNSAILMSGCVNCTFGTIDSNFNAGQVLVLDGNNQGISVGTLACDSNAAGLISDTNNSSNSNIHIRTLVCPSFMLGGNVLLSSAVATKISHVLLNSATGTIQSPIVPIPASGGSTSPLPIDCRVYWTNGSISALSVTDVSGQSVAVSPSLQQLIVPAGCSVRLTYTAAPTWSWLTMF